jgi:signal peptidase II
VAETAPEQRVDVDVRVGSTTNALAPVSMAERSLGAGAWQWAGLAAVVAAAVIGDQVTKHVVTSRLALGESSHVIGPLSIHRVENPGIAFGLFTSATGVVIALTALAVLWMLIYFARSGARHPMIPAGLGLLIGGSVSNLLDRVRLGHVTDFIDVSWWPAFNLADSCIVIGVGLLLAAMLGADHSNKQVRRHMDVAAR